MNRLARHWNFAFGQALFGLERLVSYFDFTAERGIRNFAGVPTPDDLISIIDGFLSERELLLGGDVTRLEQARARIVQAIAPAFSAGEDAARQRWANASPSDRAQIAALDRSEVSAEAFNMTVGVFSPPEADWFVQGFCRRWYEIDLFDYLKTLLD